MVGIRLQLSHNAQIVMLPALCVLTQETPAVRDAIRDSSFKPLQRFAMDHVHQIIMAIPTSGDVISVILSVKNALMD
jgi:hypothetical protein